MGDGNQAGAAAAAISYAPNTFGGRAKLKDIFGPDGWWQAEVNKRNNKDAALYPYYQINPYTKKCLTYVTGKVNVKPAIPLNQLRQIEGYETIREFVYKPFVGPQMKKCHPETEMQRYGWFPDAFKMIDGESYDERFVFTHTTPEFIKVDAMISRHDKLMRELGQVQKKEQAGDENKI